MRQTGTVKFFNQTKGFGFITPDQGGKDVFVHITAVERSKIGSLDEGMRVSFETEPDKRGKGPKAVNLEARERGPVTCRPREDKNRFSRAKVVRGSVQGQRSRAIFPRSLSFLF